MTKDKKMNDVTINIQPTPNPNALKFIVSMPVKKSGKSSYTSPAQCHNNVLCTKLFLIRGVDQLHLFDNVITVTKFDYAEWKGIEDDIVNCLKAGMPFHDPDFEDVDVEADRKDNFSPELRQIDDLLEKYVRSGLRGDGGDIQALSYVDNVLTVRYEGACGTCPSASTGTLEAIKAVLQDQFNPDIDVYIAPEYYSPTPY